MEAKAKEKEMKKESKFKERYLKKKEVALMASCSTRTVDRWASDGRLPRWKIGNLIRFKEADVLAIIERQST